MIEFSLRHQCKKCRYDRFDWAWVPECNHLLAGLTDVAPHVHDQHLNLRCQQCGYTFAMRTHDYTETTDVDDNGQNRSH